MFWQHETSLGLVSTLWLPAHLRHMMCTCRHGSHKVIATTCTCTTDLHSYHLMFHRYLHFGYPREVCVKATSSVYYFPLVHSRARTPKLAPKSHEFKKHSHGIYQPTSQHVVNSNHRYQVTSDPDTLEIAIAKLYANSHTDDSGSERRGAGSVHRTSNYYERTRLVDWETGQLGWHDGMLSTPSSCTKRSGLAPSAQSSEIMLPASRSA